MVHSETAAEVDAVTAVLQDWRQGDVALDATWFAHAADLSIPLSSAAREAAESGAGVQLLSTDVDGLVVVTQSCDIVRDARVRPYVEVSPLIAVDEQTMDEARRGRRPGLLYIPGVVDRLLVGDLDRTMTVEKTILASWTRTAGASTDEEVRAIGQALARKRARFAFPEDFAEFFRPLERRLAEKHDKASAEGAALRALDEIRVTASPCWDAPEIKLFFHFLRPAQLGISAAHPGHEQLLEAWLRLIPPRGRFIAVEGVVVDLADLRADEYVGSDRLDLDRLSTG